MDDFYRKIAGFTDISSIVDDQFYHAVPDDWFVSVVDVRGSTQAIEQGRYRDVNFIGAAAITAHLNLIDRDLPFVFGGDGAALLVTKNMREKVLKVLQSLSYYAQESFGLTLHVGLVPVSELRKHGKELKVAKFLAGDNVIQAMFKGGGITLAEKLVKAGSEYRCSARPVVNKSEIFSGLTCRWKPIPSSRGVTLSLLIQPVTVDDQTTLNRIIAQMKYSLGRSFSSLNPIRMERAEYHSFITNLKRQLRVTDLRLNVALFSELFKLLMSAPLFNLKWFSFIPAVKEYVEQVPLHCDFQKYDDTLRMVLDCSPAEAEVIETLLISEFEREQVIYGIHRSDAAQMTCYVESMSSGGHLHFVDGSDGGYALAARQLKASEIPEVQCSDCEV